MAAQQSNLEGSRERLSRTILQSLFSWPDLHRAIFVQAHYEGRSTDQISYSLQLAPAEVRLILQGCETRLRLSLKAFRKDVPICAVQASSSGCCH